MALFLYQLLIIALTLSLLFEEHEKLVLFSLTKKRLKIHLFLKILYQRVKEVFYFKHLIDDLSVRQVTGVWHLERGAFILPEVGMMGIRLSIQTI